MNRSSKSIDQRNNKKKKRQTALPYYNFYFELMFFGSGRRGLVLANRWSPGAYCPKERTGRAAPVSAAVEE